MLQFKPRMRVGTKVSTWKAINETKNRGPMSGTPLYDYTPYNLNGVAYKISDNNIRLMSFQGSNGAWMTFRRTIDSMPLTIECDFNQEYNRSNPADGIIINLSTYNGSYNLTGGTGGNIGFVTSTPTIGFVIDNWSNSGQSVPQFSIKDSRLGDAFRNTSPWSGLSWAEVTGRNTVKVEITDFEVKMYNNGILKISSGWGSIDGGLGLPSGPWVITISSATGASTQLSEVRWVKVNGSYWFGDGV